MFRSKPIGFHRSSTRLDGLPVEILREIFIKTYPPRVFKRDAIAPRVESILLPRRLSHVSRRWRAVAISFGELWSYLSLSVDGGITKKHRTILHLLLTFLERTNKYPINFRFRFSFSEPLQEEAGRAVEQMIVALLEHQHQWRDVDFTWRGLEISSGFRGLEMMSMPLLKTLSLNVSLKTPYGEDYFPCLDISLSSQIEAIVINGNFRLKASGPPKSKLVKCALKTTGESPDTRNANMCIDVLRVAPKLQSMELSVLPSYIPSSEFKYAPPRVHCLRELSLRYAFSSEIVIESLTLPVLETLYYCDGNERNGGDAVLRMLQRSRPRLTHMTLRGAHIQDTKMIEILRLLPTLIELDIVTCPTTVDLLRAFDVHEQTGTPQVRPGRDEYVLCPRLRSLRLHRISMLHDEPEEIASAALASMIDSRITIMGTFDRFISSRRQISLANRNYEAIKTAFQTGSIISLETSNTNMSPFTAAI